MALSAASLNSYSFLRFGSLVGISKTGVKKTINFEDDSNLFQVLVEGGVTQKEGTCMGNLACGKCLIKVVGGKIPTMEDEEKDLLEDAPAGSRLACAIVLNGECEGATIQVL